jgi:hypothetical protein
MFLVYGKRSFIIKKFTDHTLACPGCRAFNLHVEVRKSYYHLFYIPFFPSWEKDIRMYCGDCGQPYSKGELITEYEQKTKNPVYLYSGLILVATLILLIVYINLQTQKQKAEYVANPQTGDTYLIREKNDSATTYYFLRVTRIHGDTVFTNHSNLEYSRFVSGLDKEDFFVQDEVLFYSKAELKKMLEYGEINAVDREEHKK